MKYFQLFMGFVRKMPKLVLCFSIFFSCLPIHSDTDSLTELKKVLAKQLKLDSGLVGISYYDISSGEFLSINGDVPFNPASVIKLPVMVEAFRQHQMGQLDFRQTIMLKPGDKMWGSGSLFYRRAGTRFTIKDLIDAMITDSDNTATKMLIDYLGMSNINRTMKKMGLKNTYIGTTDLLKAEGLNYTSPNDMSKLLMDIHNSKVVSNEASAEMLAILLRQKHRWGIPRFLPTTLKIANKTGSVSGVRNDAAIIFFKDKPYVLSIFTNNMRSNDYAKFIVNKVSQDIFEWKSSVAERKVLPGSNT